MTRPTTGDPLADAILALADHVRAATDRIVDAYLAARWPEAEATAYCSTCPQVEGHWPGCRPDTTQVLVADLAVGDVVRFGSGDTHGIVAVIHGADEFSTIHFDDDTCHVWISDETVPVILVDCPACDGHGFGRNCDCCAGAGRVTGSKALSRRHARAAARLSMEEADIVAEGVA